LQLSAPASEIYFVCKHMAPLSSSFNWWRQLTIALVLLVTTVLADRNPRLKRHDGASILEKMNDQQESILNLTKMYDPGAGSEDVPQVNAEVIEKARKLLEKEKIESGGTICGSKKIANDVRDAIVNDKITNEKHRVTGIKWDKIFEIMDEQKKVRQVTIDALTEFVNKMTQEEKSGDTKADEEAVKKLVNDALKSGFSVLVGHDESDPLKIAGETDCGKNVQTWLENKTAGALKGSQMFQALKPWKNKLKDEEKYRNVGIAGLKKFKELVEAFLQENNGMYIDERAVYKYIVDVYYTPNLGTGENKDDSYCDELAAAYRDKVVLSNKAFDRKAQVVLPDDALYDLSNKQQQIVDETKKNVECAEEYATLNNFKKELDDLQAAEEVQNLKVENANDKLEEAKFELVDLQEATIQQARVLSEAKELLVQAKALTAETNQTFENAIAAERKINQTISDTENIISALVQKLEVAQAAHSVAGTLKTKVTRAMMEVIFLYKALVGKRLETMGLDNNGWETYWDQVPAESKQAVEESVRNLETLCAADGSAMKAFKDVEEKTKIKPSPEPLCPSGLKASISEEVITKVKSLADESKNAILKLKEDYLDPVVDYKEEHRQPENLAYQEPQGLEAIIGHTTLYKTYLKHWYKTDKDSFEKLIENLGLHIEGLIAEKAKLDEEMRVLLEQQKEVMKTTQIALEAFRAAIDNQKIKQSAKDDAEELYNQAVELENAKRQDVDDFTNVAKTAQKKLDDIVGAMKDAHGRAISFLQRVEKLHETGALYAARGRFFQHVEGAPTLEAP